MTTTTRKTKTTKSTTSKSPVSPSTKEYIYAKYLKEVSSNFGKNIQVVVVKNKNYTGKISTFEGTDFVYIKERLYKNHVLVTGNYYRFLVLEKGNYMGKNYVKRMEITELPEKMKLKYDRLSLEKWAKKKEMEEEEFNNTSPTEFSDED